MASGDNTGGFRSNRRNAPSLKKRKVTVTVVEETLEYRISEFPDLLLIEILSLLPTRDAFKTCVLSKRWQYLWTAVYNFNFDSYDLTATEQFGSFVDCVFSHSTCSKIKNLGLVVCTEIDNYPSHYNRWLSFAVKRKVKHVVLSEMEGAIDIDEITHAFPESFCTCSSMKSSHVEGALYMKFDGSVKWNSLKSIKVDFMVLRDANVAKLLSGCPVLENMELHIFEGGCVEIKSSNLRSLIMKEGHAFFEYDIEFVEIVAPYLQHLEISGDLRKVMCVLASVSSLVSAKLTYQNRCGNDDCVEFHECLRTTVSDNLQKLSYATELTVGSWFTKVMCMLQLEGVPLPELKCKFLTLDLYIKHFSLYGAAGFLRALPHVETLVINIGELWQRDHCRFELKYLARGDSIDLQSSISCKFPNLKNVKIKIGISSDWLCLKDQSKQVDDKLFKLSEFLLKNATVLEKFVIVSQASECRRCSMSCVSLYLFQLAGRLLRCPRSSTNSLIIFQE